MYIWIIPVGKYPLVQIYTCFENEMICKYEGSVKIPRIIVISFTSSWASHSIFYEISFAKWCTYILYEELYSVDVSVISMPCKLWLCSGLSGRVFTCPRISVLLWLFCAICFRSDQIGSCKHPTQNLKCGLFGDRLGKILVKKHSNQYRNS